MKKIKFIISLVLLFVGIGLVNAQDIPDRPNPPRLVNDYAGLLSTEQQNMLERKLVNFNDSTSTQIAVVIVKSLNGYEAADYAQRLGEKWGVGQKGKNNGLVFLISPSEKKVFLAPGYGLEAVIPDATCKLIIENEIKPYFKQNDFNTGINKAVTVLMSLAKKDYPASAYNKKHENKKGSGLAGFIFIIFIIIIIFVSKVMAGKKKSSDSRREGAFLDFVLVNDDE